MVLIFVFLLELLIHACLCAVFFALKDGLVTWCLFWAAVAVVIWLIQVGPLAINVSLH